MPNGFPDLSDFVDELGEPSDSVLAEARSRLVQVITAGDVGVPVAVPTAVEPSVPDSRRFTGRNPSRSRWKAPALVVAVAAASIAAIVVPLSVRSGQSALLPVPTSPTHVGPLADTAATPKGWSPVAFGNAQISVPSSWFVEVPGFTCGGGVQGMVFVAKAPRLPRGMGCSYPTNIVSLRIATRSPLRHARTAIVNGVYVHVGSTRAGSTLTYVERGLGMDLSASGPFARKVLGTITHSPLSVVLGSSVSGTPHGWRTADFGGLQFAVPGSWRLTRDSWWGGCPLDIAAKVLRLSTAQTLSVPSCPAPPTNAGYESALPGMVVGAGPQVSSQHTQGEACLNRDELRICIEPAPLLGGFTPGRQLSLLTAEVFVPGQAGPDDVEIGLAGSGLTPLRIFDSLRPATG